MASQGSAAAGISAEDTESSKNALSASRQSDKTDSAMQSARVSVNANGSIAQRFFRKHILELSPYTPIVPFDVLSQQLGFSVSNICKLDANQNPYGPPPAVLEALGSMDFPHIYPDPQTRKLREMLAKDCGCPAENLLVGCGADELIDLLLRAVLDGPSDVIIDIPPTFTMYAFDTAVNNGTTVSVPRNPDFTIDLPAVHSAITEHKPKIVFLTSPNNPDGSILEESQLLAVLEMDTIVVLDEAYIEFSETPSRINLVPHYENLIVLRTFSKRAGLAGLRVGYGAFPTGMMDYLWRMKQPYNVSVAAEVAAIAALGDLVYLDAVKQKLIAERQRMYAELQKMAFLRPYPSEANFILCAVLGTGRTAADVKADLAKQYGICIRHYAKKYLDGFIRISVGRPEQTDRVITALKEMSKAQIL